MKKLTIMMVFAAFAATSLFALNKGETEIENDGWFRYVAGAKAFDFKNPTRSDFNLERGYIRLSHQWTTALFSKMTVDVFGSSAYADGATIRLKEAYVDWTLPVSFLDVRLTPGLQKHYFGLIYSWDYTHLEKSLADKEGIISSADYGVTLNGFLPKGLGEFQVGAYNGEGYKKIYASSNSLVNTVPEITGNLRLTPFAGLQIGASILSNASDRSNYKFGTGTYYKPKSTVVAFADTANINRLGISPMAKVAVGPVSVLGEYLSYNYKREYHYWASDTLGKVTDSTVLASDKKYSMNGFSVVPVISLFKKHLELVGRYDMWNISSEQSDGSMARDTLKSHSMFGAGFNYHLQRREKSKPGVELQVMWQHEQPTATSQKPTDLIMAQVRFEWTGLIVPQ
jgi:hypothetical protein